MPSGGRRTRRPRPKPIAEQHARLSAPFFQWLLERERHFQSLWKSPQHEQLRQTLIAEVLKLAPNADAARVRGMASAFLKWMTTEHENEEIGGSGLCLHIWAESCAEMLAEQAGRLNTLG